jgi:hypothetical protein
VVGVVLICVIAGAVLGAVYVKLAGRGRTSGAQPRAADQ